MKTINDTINKKFYVCYGENILKGFFLCSNVSEARKKIDIYNNTHKDKIVVFKETKSMKEYTVK